MANDDDTDTNEALDPARMLPFSREIGENPLGKAIEGGALNEPYQS